MPVQSYEGDWGICVTELQDIHRLQAFVAVVDEGSLSAAVSKLHLTQPALSARLKLLEESLGCLLLERTGRGVRPTPIGKLVYQIALDILKRMNQLHTTVKNHLEMREGWIHLAGDTTAVTGVFPNAIAFLRQAHPNIQFSLSEQDSNDVVNAVQDGAVDIGIITSKPPTVGMFVHGIIRDELCIVASTLHPLVAMNRELRSVGKSLLPLHFNRQQMILFEEGSSIRSLIDWELRRLYIHPRVIMTLKSMQSMLHMVQKNMGLSVVSKLTLGSFQGIQVLPVEGLRMDRELIVISAEGRTLSPAATEFSKILLEDRE